MRILRSGRLSQDGAGRSVGRRGPDLQAGAGVDSVQSWRAWSGCGDGAQLHLVIDSAAGQVWLLPAEEAPMHARSIE
jgi:hypothetical protein